MTASKAEQHTITDEAKPSKARDPGLCVDQPLSQTISQTSGVCPSRSLARDAPDRRIRSITRWPHAPRAELDFASISTTRLHPDQSFRLGPRSTASSTEEKDRETCRASDAFSPARRHLPGAAAVLRPGMRSFARCTTTSDQVPALVSAPALLVAARTVRHYRSSSSRARRTPRPMAGSTRIKRTTRTM